MWQKREIKHFFFFLFKILWDTSSWHGNCTEISSACSSPKLIEIGSWLEGYWYKPLTLPTPWRGEWASGVLPFSQPNVKVPLSKAINHYVLKWNDSVADIRMSLCMAALRCEYTSLHGLGFVWKRMCMFCKTFTPKSKWFNFFFVTLTLTLMLRYSNPSSISIDGACYWSLLVMLPPIGITLYIYIHPWKFA